MFHSEGLKHSDVTPHSVYLTRRCALAALSALALPISRATAGQTTRFTSIAKPSLANVAKTSYGAGEALTPQSVVTGYNDFYEFGSAKDEPAQNAAKFVTSPWTITMDGEVSRPVTVDLDRVMKLAPLEERIYRHRCVEGWSMVVPWIGYSLSALLKQVQPTAKAKFVAFQTYFDAKKMPDAAALRFPYVEGLRLDEAMNPLTLLCVGLYGTPLPNQNGAPVRVIVPWKYGLKSIKSIVKITFQESMPATTWNTFNPVEYGFYSNVNPAIENYRWNQKDERRLGEFGKRPTQLFNGYIKEVASMYAGMDLKKNY